MLLAATLLAHPAAAESSGHDTPPTAAVPARAGGEETVQQAVCRLITGAAGAHRLPVEFLTRLIWQESSFRSGATSAAGAQGIAQFMPGTAAERGLDDPFDPEKAIPASAALLADLRTRFGNLGLAAAAYNAGPGRVAAWLAGRGGLPFETTTYVERITGRSAEDWRTDADKAAEPDPKGGSELCLQLARGLRTAAPTAILAIEASAPWGVQLAGNFSKALALASFARARASYAALLGDIQPMVIGTRLRTRGTRAFYRVRVPEPTRGAADDLCRRIHTARGACVVLRS